MLFTPYSIRHEGRTIYECRYWNVGRPLGVVAVPGGIGDWAAYIGSSEDRNESCEATMVWIAAHGCKLDRREAEAFVPAEVVVALGGMGKYRD